MSMTQLNKKAKSERILTFGLNLARVKHVSGITALISTPKYKNHVMVVSGNKKPRSTEGDSY